MKKYISYDKSMKKLYDINIKTYIESVSLMDSQNRILAEDIIAKYSSPEVPTSAMDGYAIKFADIENELEIIDFNFAGKSNTLQISTNTCVKTMTGAIMPAGSDTLVPIENVEVNDKYIKIIKSVDKGFAIRAIGENFQCGDKLIKEGTKIDFAEIGVLASLNIPIVKVYKRPTVSILSTGSEILDLGEIQTSLAQIRSSNHYTIEAMAKKYGANTIQLGVVKDDYETIKERVKTALEISDIVVTTGGVSVGDYDFVKDIIKKDLGAEIIFQGVNIKPGQHVVLAQLNNKFIIGLPGFAYSSTVTAILYLIPLIQKFQNIDYKAKIVKGKLLERYEKRFSKATFKACNLTYVSDQYFVDFENKKDGTSAILTNILNGCYLMVSNDYDESKEVGEFVDVLIV